ncbi:MAG TPA: hypothetical protein PK969_11305 [Treponemataceae bacterium]|nr:hypothetical protein [Treponemataceae bacterium]
MDNKSVMSLFFVLILIFIFSFTLSLDAIANNNAMYGVYALVGFIILVGLSLFESVQLSKDGVTVAYWFKALSIISLVILVWYCTRAGVLFGWW